MNTRRRILIVRGTAISIPPAVLAKTKNAPVVIGWISLGSDKVSRQLHAFKEGLSALVPRPRLHLIRFHGVLAPHAKLRAAVVPDPVQETSEPTEAHAHGKSARMRWARLLKRVYDIDTERCGCGGQLKIIAAILE